MVFEDWINDIIGKGILCEGYTDKLTQSHSKLQVMRIVLDANGISWLPEMDSKGYPLPYDTILREFKNYINGNYVAEFYNERGNGYTSALYCCFSDSNEIDVNTTLAVFLGCSNVTLSIAENHIAHIYLDKNCDVNVVCPETSKVIIDYWDGAKFTSDNVQNTISKLNN